jgi:hypothetical protein
MDTDGGWNLRFKIEEGRKEEEFWTGFTGFTG